MGGLGVFFPFFSIYLGENLQLSGSQVGTVLAVMPLVGVIVQPLWGQLGDVSGERARMLAGIALAAAIAYAALAFGQSFASMIVAVAALACFSTPLMPTATAVSFGIARDHGARAFGYMRVWGTLGFLIMVVAFPLLLDGLDDRRPHGNDITASEPSLAMMFPVTALLMALGAIAALTLPRGGEHSLRAPRGEWRQLLRHRPYVRLIFFAFLAYFALQGPMSIFGLFVTAHGGSADTVSQLWIPMLIVEIPLIALSGKTLERFGARGLISMGLIAGGVRWLGCALAPNAAWILPLQMLHGIVVAGMVLGAPLYVEAAVPARLRATGQGVLGMIGVSLGGILSTLTAGWLFERFGPTAPYLFSGALALGLGLATPLFLPKPHPPETVETAAHVR